MPHGDDPAVSVEAQRSADPVDDMLGALLYDEWTSSHNTRLESGEVRDHTAGLLRGLHQRLRHLTQRTRNLELLYETAGDLSSLQDLEALLGAIVRRGRAILGTDVAYLMLIDEVRGDTYMRVSEGTVGRDFRHIRLPLGHGLGGLVAQTGQPMWSADYLEDHRFLHKVDPQVVDDGLTAILGVPLLVEAQVIGVLFAADRHRRSFTPDEVALLASLGAHAAIALRSATLIGEMRQTLAELTTAKLLAEAGNLALQQQSDMHATLAELLLAGSDEQGLAEALSEVIPGTLLVIAPSSRLLARAGGATGAPELDDPRVGELIRDAKGPLLDQVDPGESERGTHAANLAGVDGHLFPVGAATTHLGWLFHAGQLDSGATRSLEHAATVTALLWMTRRAEAEASQRLQREMLSDLLKGRATDFDALLRRAEMLGGGDFRHDLSVFVFVPTDSNREFLAELEAPVRKHTRGRRGLVAQFSDRIVMVLPGSLSNSGIDQVKTALIDLSGGDPRFAVGGSESSEGFAGLATAESEASRSARLALALGRYGWLATPHELGILGLLLADSSRESIEAFVEGTIGRLIRHDAAKGTQLLRTAEAYFDREGSVALAAEDLFVHPNTMYNRLERIDVIEGSAWRLGERAISLRVALKLRRLLVDRPGN